jgi:hypothetical protein
MTVKMFANRRHIICLVLWIFCTHVAIPSWRDLVKQGEILATRVFGSSKIPEKKIIQKMLDLVANARRSLDIL